KDRVGFAPVLLVVARILQPGRMIHASLCSRRLWRDRRPCPPGGNRRPGPGDVRIEIHAASLNPIDFKIAHGDLKRVSKYQLPRPFGFDASGVVTSVGAGASKFKPGDAVFVRASRDTIGTFAEQIALGENLVALKPATISHAE